MWLAENGPLIGIAARVVPGTSPNPELPHPATQQGLGWWFQDIDISFPQSGATGFSTSTPVTHPCDVSSSLGDVQEISHFISMI